MSTRAQNEKKFGQWDELPGGGRRYRLDVPGAARQAGKVGQTISLPAPATTGRPSGRRSKPEPSGRSPDPQLGLMKAYFEQWLNGLVYELFFPGELHARKLTLFAETARLAPPDLRAVPEAQKLARLQELFARAYEGNAPLRAMLFDLTSLDVVRIIEEAGASGARLAAPEAET